PNAVGVLDIEELEDELVLVMEYIEGGPLSELLPVPPRVAIRILLDVAAGLGAAHALTDDEGRLLDLVHRDVSPHNVLVGTDGVARVTDFGVAKMTTPNVPRASTGALKGKPAYMAPEYVLALRSDARSDVFSLGVLAWEALSGRRLFKATEEIATLEAVVS